MATGGRRHGMSEDDWADDTETAEGQLWLEAFDIIVRYDTGEIDEPEKAADAIVELCQDWASRRGGR